METADSLQLRPQDREVLQGLLARFVPSMEAWAYGSRVSGRPHALSDLDLVIRNPADLKKQQGPEFWELKEALSESNILCIVDLHDWARLPAEFYPNIEVQHVTLQTPRGGV